MRTILLTSVLILTANLATCDEGNGKNLNCVLLEKGDEIVQLWALPNRDGIDVQVFADKHLPVTYVHEIDLVLRPPRNVKVQTLSVLQIAKLKSLTTIDLAGTNVTDDDVSVLSSMPNLECLVLDWTNVSDACLEHVRKCKKLRILSLHGCGVTDDATNRLQYVLPGLVRITGDGNTVISMQEQN